MGVDAPLDTAAELGLDAGPDGQRDGPAGPPSNGVCSKAALLKIPPSGKVTVQGNTTLAPGEFGAKVSCSSGKDFVGNQLYYRVSLPAGKATKITVNPNTAWDPSLYAFTAGVCDPATINVRCADHVADNAPHGQPESLTLIPTKTAEVVIVVDSAYTSASSVGKGPFTLRLVSADVPANASCAAAASLSAAKATVTGDTSLAPNEHGAQVTCGGSTAFTGAQLYYEVSLEAGKGYRMTLAPQFAASVYFFRSPACSSAAVINGDCASGGLAGDYYYVKPGAVESFYIKGLGGAHTIAVDSGSPAHSGTFSLSMEALALPKNTSCLAAQTLALSGAPAKATIAGDTGVAYSELGAQVTCGGKTGFGGPQLYYKVSLAAKQQYRITLSPKFSSYLYLFQASSCGSVAAINADCSGKSAAGSHVFAAAGRTTSIYLKPGAAVEYLIAVDSAFASHVGKFTLAVDQLLPPVNDTCTAALALTLGGAPATATVTADTFGAKDQYPKLTCGGSAAFDGPQLYYQVSMTANKRYVVSLTPQFAARAYLFRASACGALAAVEADCASGGAGGDHTRVAAGKTGQLLFSPAASGDYLVAVDSTASSAFGLFTLQVSELPVPTFAAPLSWSFEAGCKGLAATGDWECGQIAFSPGPACGSSYTPPASSPSGVGKGMWGTRLHDCYDPRGNNGGAGAVQCSNAAPADDSILMFQVTVPASWSAAALTYHSWEDVNGHYDWMEVRVNGAAAKTTCKPMPKPAAWVKNTVDLSAHVGETVTIAFHFMASTTVQYAGWYLDELSVTGS